jgi:hypothetical protein
VELKFINPEKEETAQGKKRLFESTKTKTQKSPHELFKITIGLYNKKVVSELQKHTNLTMNQNNNVITSLCNLLREQFYERIWKRRCKELNALEKLLGITTKKKRIKEDRSPRQEKKSRKTSKKKAKNPNIPTQGIQDNQGFNAIPAIVDKIKSWVQFGIKWLGI